MFFKQNPLDFQEWFAIDMIQPTDAIPNSVPWFWHFGGPTSATSQSGTQARSLLGQTTLTTRMGNVAICSSWETKRQYLVWVALQRSKRAA